MKKMILVLAGTMLFSVSCNQSGLRKETGPTAHFAAATDLEVRRLMEQGVEYDERQRQARAIAVVFAKRTTPERAHKLAALCYLKTLGTDLMPLDLAEIALSETGSLGFNAKAVSPKGALGVWQLMPYRAASHGYRPEEMQDDEKCAEAAVRELYSKLDMADGDLVRAKKLYCGVGPEADAYEIKRRRYRREILRELEPALPVRAQELRIEVEQAS
ncbi:MULTISPECIES: transglycosylase SLT domain-containing protein [Geobacter]|uniref:transglycosylase SLT domain-containing protein n=1 Tax=Geobacter TaxID=28231 RepID=UPI000E64EB65|nr:transglycosylase SLT domain-containing protein [Geobacter sulfurreducens]HML78779.1 transglycosylase SLT domain-containing protein [Geobacter sulfurreducens]